MDRQIIEEEAGATTVEMALVSGLLLFVIFVGIDMLYLSYQALSLQYTATTVLRQAVLGEPEVLPPGYNHVDTMKNRMKDLAAGFGLELLPSQISICPVVDPNCPVSYSAEPGEIIIVQINFPSRVLFVDQYNVNATAIGRNEPT